MDQIPTNDRIAGSRRHFAVKGEFRLELPLEPPSAHKFEKNTANHWGSLASMRSTAVESRSQVSCCSVIQARSKTY